MADAQPATRPSKRYLPPKSRTVNAKALKAAAVAMTEKEHIAPQKPKRVVQIDGIFNQDKSMKQKRERERDGPGEVSNVLPPKSPGVTRQTAKSGYSSKFARNDHAFQGHTPDPDFLRDLQRPPRSARPSLDFLDAIEAYSTSATNALKDEHKRRRLELEDRRSGLDENGAPQEPYVPTWEEIKELEEQIQTIGVSTRDDLGEEMMTVLIDQKDGTWITKNVRFKETLAEFFARYDRKFTKIKELEAELVNVESELDGLTADLTGESEEVKMANAQHEAETAKLEIELQNIETKANKGVHEIKKKETRRKQELNDKVNKLLKDLG